MHSHPTCLVCQCTLLPGLLLGFFFCLIICTVMVATNRPLPAQRKTCLFLDCACRAIRATELHLDSKTCSRPQISQIF